MVNGLTGKLDDNSNRFIYPDYGGTKCGVFCFVVCICNIEFDLRDER